VRDDVDAFGGGKEAISPFMVQKGEPTINIIEEPTSPFTYTTHFMRSFQFDLTNRMQGGEGRGKKQ
jgi:hypothetical protein